MLFALVYLLLRWLFQLVTDSSNDLTRDIEVVVLRHQLMVLKRQAGLKGAGTRIPSRCGLVFVYEAAQDVAADEASSAVLRAPRAIGPLGRLELQATVRPVPVVVGGVGA